MMLARTYGDIDVFDQAASSLAQATSQSSS
jgi:hypothetical protein